MIRATPYGMTRIVDGAFDEIRERVAATLAAQGFGVLTRIDVQATLREKIGVRIERYEILGACNPHLAAHALGSDRAIGLLLPCNVVLRDVGGRVEVSAVDPERMLALTDPATRTALGDVPADARRRLRAALEQLVPSAADAPATSAPPPEPLRPPEKGSQR